MDDFLMTSQVYIVTDVAVVVVAVVVEDFFFFGFTIVSVIGNSVCILVGTIIISFEIKKVRTGNRQAYFDLLLSYLAVRMTYLVPRYRFLLSNIVFII